MGSVAPAFLDAFRARADAGGTMSFDRFVAIALYDPSVGYYRRAQRRIGREAGTAFGTATRTGPLCGELIAAAAAALLAPRDPRGFDFGEVGSEPAGGVLGEAAHPFGASRTARVGEPLELTGPCVVFANELLDAQPFRRFAFRGGAWRELGVELGANGLAEVEMSEPRAAPAFPLPPAPSEGDRFDAPSGAVELLDRIAAQPWTGLFLTCDYGKTWNELAAHAARGGTARGYFRHRQVADLLDRPGEQDLTCHVCWDWLEAALVRHGFAATAVTAQEAFLVRHTAGKLEAAVADEPCRFSPRKAALLQLLHPDHFGRKFQVLQAYRGL